MKDFTVRARSAARVRRGRAVRPTVEGLEGRYLLYSYTGDHFFYGNLITWSIMPDGTNLGGTTSNLVATLNAKLGAGVWEQAISDAFAQWENYGNINVSQVSDDGEAFNAGGYQQGNPNFGDIRIGGFAQASNVLAFTMIPPPSNGGSDSGDIFFNTAQTWNINSTFDLESVAAHEIGHAVAGLGESSDVNAVEYEYYTGTKQSLDQDDVNGIQAVWGPRAEDVIATYFPNYTSAQAFDLTPYINPYNNDIYLPNQDVAKLTDSYWFKVTTPSNANTSLWVQLQSAGLSELSPKVQIYNSSLQGLTQVSAPYTTYGTTIYASVGNVTPGQTYYIHVSGSSALANGTGAYAMALDLGPWPLILVTPPNTTVYAQPDQGGGGLFEKSASADISDVFTSKPSSVPISKPSSTSATPQAPISDLIALGAIQGQAHSLIGTSTPTTSPSYNPTYINVPHPVVSYARKLLVPQDRKTEPVLL